MEYSYTEKVQVEEEKFVMQRSATTCQLFMGYSTKTKDNKSKHRQLGLHQKKKLLYSQGNNRQN